MLRGLISTIKIPKNKFKNIKLLGGRRMPSVLRMTPEDKPGEFTEVIYESLKFNIDIKDSFFSLNQLRRKY